MRPIVFDIRNEPAGPRVRRGAVNDVRRDRQLVDVAAPDAVDETPRARFKRAADTRARRRRAGEVVILVAAGDLHNVVTKAEAALIASGLPIYQRGSAGSGGLVRPVMADVPATRGRMTTTAALVELTHPALVDAMSESTTFERFDKRSNEHQVINPPGEVAQILLHRKGRWNFPKIVGVITTPTIRPDGSLLSKPGYDPETRLYHFADAGLRLAPAVHRPTRTDAERALADLLGLLAEFPFTTDEARAVALSGLITPVARGAMTVAPLHLFRASTAGSGKSFLVDLASAIAVGRPAPVMSAGRDEKEFESRLVGLLLAGYPMVSVDNVNGELGGDLLCQAVERPLVRLRPLGRSDIIEIETRATVFATGNNARVAGDMTRRTVVADLDAGMERPELRQFSGDPVDTVMADRGRYVSACLIITRAYIAAGCPAMLPPIASFADWSGVVRSALVWLGCADPAETMNAARDDDPELMGIREMFAAWEAAFGIGTDTTVKAVCDEAEVHLIDDKHGHRLPERRNPELYDAVSKVAGERGTLNTLRLSKWLARNKGRIVGGKRIEKSTIAGHNNVTQWSLNHAGR